MTAKVRVYFHAGLTTAPVAASTRFTTDSVSMLKQPYEGRSVIDVGTGAAVSSAAAPKGTKIALIQVEEGKAVHLEVNPAGRIRLHSSHRRCEEWPPRFTPPPPACWRR